MQRKYGKNQQIPTLRVSLIKMEVVDKPNDRQITFKFTTPHRLCATRSSQPNLGFGRSTCRFMLPGTMLHSEVSIHSTLTWACHSAIASPGCPVSCTDHGHYSLLTRAMKGVKAREEFAIAIQSDILRWTLLFSPLWIQVLFLLRLSILVGWCAYVNSSSTRVFLHFFYERKDMISPPWEMLTLFACYSETSPEMDSAAGAPSFAFPHSFPPIILAGIKALNGLLTTDEHVLPV